MAGEDTWEAHTFRKNVSGRFQYLVFTCTAEEKMDAPILDQVIVAINERKHGWVIDVQEIRLTCFEEGIFQHFVQPENLETCRNPADINACSLFYRELTVDTIEDATFAMRISDSRKHSIYEEFYIPNYFGQQLQKLLFKTKSNKTVGDLWETIREEREKNFYLQRQLLEATQVIQAIKNQRDEIEFELKCNICTENKKNKVFTCGHTACGECAAKLDGVCHICRRDDIWCHNLHL